MRRVAAAPAPSGTADGGSRWNDLVARIQRNESTALEELYRLFSRGVRFYLCRHLGPQDLEDRIHDSFVIVAEAVLRGSLRDPARLMGFVRTVVRRQVAAQIERNIAGRKHLAGLDAGSSVPAPQEDPEERAMGDEERSIARQVLTLVPRRDREVLMRFYLREQSPNQICRAMHLTETQFRLLKSRAKARFGQLGRRLLAGQPITANQVPSQK